VQQDVLLDDVTDVRAVVLAGAPAKRHESLLLLQSGAGHDITAWDARVTTSTPVMCGNRMQFRLELLLERRRSLGPSVGVSPS